MLTKKELAALAMHELMKREQQTYMDRIQEQRRLSTMSDDKLRALVEGVPVVEPEKDVLA